MYLSIDNVVAFSKTIVKSANNVDTNLWKDWIYQSLLYYGIGDDEIDVAELTPKDLLAPIPQECRVILELSLFDSGGNQLSHKYRGGKQRIYTDARLSTTSVGGSSNLNDYVPVDVSSDAYNIVLGTNGSNVAKILIRYFKYPLDENGAPLIREEEQMGCALFVKYMMALREDENQSKISAAELRWKLEADRLKADKKTKSMSEEKAKQVLNHMLRLIPSFDKNQF